MAQSEHHGTSEQKRRRDEGKEDLGGPLRGGQKFQRQQREHRDDRTRNQTPSERVKQRRQQKLTAGDGDDFSNAVHAQALY